MSTSTFPKMRKGEEAAQKASRGGFIPRTQFLRLKDGETAIIRPLTDINGINALITVDQHSGIPTKGKPADFDGDKWPDAMGAVCRNDPMLRDYFRNDCYICDYLQGTKGKFGEIGKPSARTWAIALLREPVEEDGKVVGYRTAMREISRKNEKGEEHTETVPAVVVLHFGWQNCFVNLSVHASVNGTVCDQDYLVKRTGNTMNDTIYHFIPLGKVEIELPDSGETVTLDTRDPRCLKLYGFEDIEDVDRKLTEIILAQADDEYYARFFDPRKEVKDGKVVEVKGAVPKPNNDVDASTLETIKARLTGLKGYTAPRGDDEAETASAEEKPADKPKPTPKKRTSFA